MKQNEGKKERKSLIFRFLNTVEQVGNRLPHPITMFAALALFIVLLSGILAAAGISAEGEVIDSKTMEVTTQTVSAVSLLDRDGLVYMLTHMVSNFTEFAPLGVVLVTMLGVGCAEGSGYLSALLKKTVSVTPAKLVTPMLVFLLSLIHIYVKAVQERDPAARNALEVLLLYQGVHALIWHRFAHWFYKHKMFFAARLISQIARFFTLIEIHPGAQLGHGILIDHGCGVVIGETTVVGDNCTIYQGVTLGGVGLNKGKRHPTLGSNVTVGAGAKILGSFEVGDNCTDVYKRQVTRSAFLISVH